MTVSAADSQKQRGQTAYHVFRQTTSGKNEHLAGMPAEDVDVTSFGPGPMFELVAESVPAANGDQAKRIFAEKNTDKLGSLSTLIAVPARSWQPSKITVEQTTVVKVGDA